MENQQIGQLQGQLLNAVDYKGTFSPPHRQHPRSLMIEELDGGFVVNAYDQNGSNTRFVAHNARVLGRKLKAWADPTPATPPAPAAPAAS